MDIKLNKGGNLRVDGGYGGCSNFINISKAGISGIRVSLFTGFQYVEVRKKGGHLRIYTFPKKSHKKDYDFEDWKDSEVVWCLL